MSSSESKWQGGHYGEEWEREREKAIASQREQACKGETNRAYPNETSPLDRQISDYTNKKAQ